MGEPVVVLFAILAVIGIVLVGLGALLRARALMMVGAALLLGLAGTWVLGLAGAAFGVIPLAYLWRRRSTTAAN